MINLGHMTTFSGRTYKPAVLSEADVCVGDIAHHLSQIVRFGGACPTPWTVAHHSLYVSELVASRHPDNARLELLALLHDAHEAYGAGDVPTPIKRLLYIDMGGELMPYSAWEEVTQEIIIRAIGIEQPTPEEAAIIQAADGQAFVDELFGFFLRRVPGTEPSGHFRVSLRGGLQKDLFHRVFNRCICDCIRVRDD